MTTTLAQEASTTKIRRSLSAETRQAHVKAWQESGLTMSAYCREHQLAISSFSVWVGKNKDKKDKAVKQFFPIKPCEKPSLSSSRLMVKVTLVNGMGVQVQAPLSLSEVIHLARELSRCN